MQLDRTGKTFHSFEEDKLVTFNATINMLPRNKRGYESTNNFLIYFFEKNKQTMPIYNRSPTIFQPEKKY